MRRKTQYNWFTHSGFTEEIFEEICVKPKQHSLLCDPRLQSSAHQRLQEDFLGRSLDRPLLHGGAWPGWPKFPWKWSPIRPWSLCKDVPWLYAKGLARFWRPSPWLRGGTAGFRVYCKPCMYKDWASAATLLCLCEFQSPYVIVSQASGNWLGRLCMPCCPLHRHQCAISTHSHSCLTWSRLVCADW